MDTKLLLLNLLISSIPEETFLTLFTLRFLRRYDLFRWNIKNIVAIMIPVLGSGVLANILRYAEVKQEIIFLVCSLFLYVLIISIHPRDFLKTLGFLMGGLIILIIVEFSYAPICFYATGLTPEDIKSDLVISLILSIPQKVILYALLAALLKNKTGVFANKEDLEVKIFETINQSRAAQIVYIGLLALNLVFLLFSFKYFVFDRMFAGHILLIQLIVIAFITIFPICNIAGSTYLVYNLARRRLVYEYHCDTGKVSKKAEDLITAIQEGNLDQALKLAERIRKATDLV